MRYLIYFSYDGRNFNGYQKQPGKRTIELELEDAISKINNKPTKVYGSGRTDSKVHALSQTAHFNLEVEITLDKLKRAINTFLPNDIHIIKVIKVRDNFNARFDVKKKIYQYYINCGEYNPLERDYVYQYCRRLNIDKINEALKYFVGKHDFSSFVSNEAKKESYIRTIYSASLVFKKNKLIFTFIGNGFMKYQVRYMVGTLIKVGEEKIDSSIIKEMLLDDKYNNLVSIVRPEGLYLKEVKY